MLVLSRLVGESIVLEAREAIPKGTRITIKVTDSRVGKSRIGVAAPQSFSVHREEVQREIDSERTPGIGEDFG